MNFNSTLSNSANDAQLPQGLTAEDIAALSNYPSLNKLFDPNDLIALNQMQDRLSNTFQALERIVLRGSNEDARRAKTAAAALKITVDFLEAVKQMKSGENRG